VEDRHDGDALTLVEVRQELHHRDLVAQVEVDSGLVEDEQRRPLGHGEGDEDELALAEGELASVAAAELLECPRGRSPRRRPLDRPRVGAERILVRKPAEGHDLLDPGENGKSPGRGRRQPAGDRRSIQPRDPVAAQGGGPAAGRTSPASARSRVDLPAPLGPMRATRSPGSIERSTPRSTARSPKATTTPSRAAAGARRAADGETTIGAGADGGGTGASGATAAGRRGAGMALTARTRRGRSEGCRGRTGPR